MDRCSAIDQCTNEWQQEEGHRMSSLRVVDEPKVHQYIIVAEALGLVDFRQAWPRPHSGCFHVTQRVVQKALVISEGLVQLAARDKDGAIYHRFKNRQRRAGRTNMS